MFSAPAARRDLGGSPLGKSVARSVRWAMRGSPLSSPLAADAQFSGEKLEREGTRHQALKGSS